MSIQESIIVESAKLFSKKGYTATGIRDIAEAVGINSATLYYYFKSKDEILLKVACKGIQLIRDAVISAMVERAQENFDIQAAIRAHLRAVIQNRNFSTVLFQETRHLSQAFKEVVQTEREEYELLWEQAFIMAQHKGILKSSLNPRLMRYIGFGALNGIIIWYDTDELSDLDELSDTIFEMVVKGILA